MSQFNPAVPSNDDASFAASSAIASRAEKMRGLPLVAVWAVLVAAPWAAICGVAALLF